MNKKDRRDTIMHSLVLVFCYIVVLLVFSVNSCAQSKCEVDSVIKAYGIKHPDIVLRQSILETGWYESYSCRERHNLFGFRWKGKYIEFDTWEESVAYYARWQKRWLKDDCCDYYAFLECLFKNTKGECVRYAGDEDYVDKLKSIEI